MEALTTNDQRLVAAQGWLDQLTRIAVEREAQLMAQIAALQGALESARAALARLDQGALKEIYDAKTLHEKRGIDDCALVDGLRPAPHR